MLDRHARNQQLSNNQTAAEVRCTQSSSPTQLGQHRLLRCGTAHPALCCSAAHAMQQTCSQASALIASKQPCCRPHQDAVKLGQDEGEAWLTGGLCEDLVLDCQAAQLDAVLTEEA